MSDLMMLAAAAAAAPVVDVPSPMLEYVSPVFLLLWAAALCLICAAIHSVLGEQKLLRPQMAAPTGVMESPLARQVTRIAWHWTSALWLLVGALLVAAAYGDIAASWLVIAVGAVHLIAGVADAVITKGRHIGWPLIVLIGALTLFSAYLTA